MVRSMSFFLFHISKVVSRPVLASIRPRLYSGNGLLRAVLTKDLVKLNSRPSSSTLVRQFSVKTTSGKAFPRIRRILKFLFIGTGVVFWCIVGLGLGSGNLKVGRHEVSNRSLVTPMMAAIYQFDPKDFSQDFAEGGNHQVMKAITEEVQQKAQAMLLVWSKLKTEKAFLERFGKNVGITGCKVQYVAPSDNNKSKELTTEDSELLTEEKDSSDVHVIDKDTWKVALYIDGSESSGLVTMEFHKVNNDETIWIPVSLLVEVLPSSGVKISDISAPLPNGLTKFTRLFSDQ